MSAGFSGLIQLFFTGHANLKPVKSLAAERGKRVGCKKRKNLTVCHVQRILRYNLSGAEHSESWNHFDTLLKGERFLAGTARMLQCLLAAEG
jgi:hypothetical protein